MSTLTTVSNEKKFVSTYLALLAVSDSPQKFPEDFKRDIKEIKGLGVKLPNLPVTKNSQSENRTAADVKCTVKSIKPPRFNLSQTSKSTDTVYHLKCQLCKSQELSGVEPSQIKFLVKGKVIQDASFLGDLVENGEDLKLTAIVSAGDSKATTMQPVEPAVQSVEPVLPWSEIKVLLESKGLDASSAVTRLQRGWELTK
jgi:hypothetical protein